MSPKIPGRTLVSGEHKVNEKSRNGARPRLARSYLGSRKLVPFPWLALGRSTVSESPFRSPISASSGDLVIAHLGPSDPLHPF